MDRYWNWLTDDVPRVARIVRHEMVEEAKAVVQDVRMIWHRVRDVLMRSLKELPEARELVVRALIEEFEPDEAG